MSGCDINKLDLCLHSVTLTDSQKEMANHQYRSYLLALQHAANEFNLPKNIYLGGSLALQEPALQFSAGKCQGVHSDLDLFVVVKSLADIPKLQSLPYQLESVMPELERSFHYGPLVPPQKDLRIVTLEDLSLGMAHPIVQDIDIDPDEYMIPAHSKSMVKMLIARLCAYCLPYRNTSHLYSNLENNKIERSPMDTIKLVLSCLRLQCYGKIADAHRISALVPLAEKGLFSELMDMADVLEWVRCREQYDPSQQLPKLGLPEFIYTALCTGTGIPLNSAIDKLLANLSSQYFSQPETIDNVALVLLSLCLHKLEPNQARLQVLEMQLLKLMEQADQQSEEFQLCEMIKQTLTDSAVIGGLAIQLFNRYMQLTTDSVTKSALNKVSESLQIRLLSKICGSFQAQVICQVHDIRRFQCIYRF